MKSDICYNGIMLTVLYSYEPAVKPDFVNNVPGNPETVDIIGIFYRDENVTDIYYSVDNAIEEIESLVLQTI